MLVLYCPKQFLGFCDIVATLHIHTPSFFLIKNDADILDAFGCVNLKQ